VRAARLLLARIEDPQRPSETVILAPRLSIRESTANFSPLAPRRLASGGVT
jgi:DNA-binding LacI/PurR family transcriptional regulator